MRITLLLILCLSLFSCATAQQVANQSSSTEIYSPFGSIKKNQTVVLLHGLNRTSRSMSPMAKMLSAQGYRVCNINYPSRYFPVKTLAVDFVLPKINDCVGQQEKVHFVSHSLGGIIVRSLDTELKKFNTGHFVMLSPPNQGSEAVDKFSKVWGFKRMAGPAGASLGTGADSVPNNLPAPSMPFGIIAAKHSNSPMSWLIPGDDDGKVTLERMQLESMQDFIVISNTHSFMMRDRETIQQVLYFLEYGEFLKISNE